MDKTLIDLTHTFTDNMPVFPGDDCSKLYMQWSIKGGDALNYHRIESGLHVGTHMDAPIHMIDGAATIADFPLTHFQARGVVVDARGRMPIDETALQGMDIRAGDIVLLRTDWDKKYRTEAYFDNWPVMTPGFAHALADRKISLIGMDTPSPDNDPDFSIHKIYLAAQVLIIENLCNLEALEGHKSFIIHAYPAKYKACGAPVRVVAEIV